MTIAKISLHCHRYICLIIYFLSLFACAGAAGPIRLYEGTKKPDDEIARLLVPSELEVVAIDGEELDVPYVPDSQYQVELLPGDHQIAVVYSEYWGDPTVGNLVVSDAFYFRIALAAGSTYMFKHDAPEDLMNADISPRDIKIWLEQPQTGQTINAVSRGTYGTLLARTIRQLGTGKEAGKPKAVVNSPAIDSGEMDSEKQTAATSQTLATQNDSSALLAEQIISQQNALVRLKFWWKMADGKQRKAFQVWIDKARISIK